jgi:hypothetical protein
MADTIAETIAHLTELEKKATPGPWSVYEEEDASDTWPDETPVICARGIMSPMGGLNQSDGDYEYFTKEDAALIVALRNAMPALLETLKQIETKGINHARLVRSLLERGEADAAKVICAIERERDAALARVRELEIDRDKERKNGDEEMMRAKELEDRLAAMTGLLRRSREHTEHCDMCGAWREENLAPLLNEIDAALKAAGEVEK